MKPRFKVELLLVALACVAPVVASYLLFYFGDLRSLPQVPNEARLLLNPAVPLPGAESADPAASWGPKWSMLYYRTAACDDGCRTTLVRLAQVHVALNRDQNRVRRVYLGPDAAELAAQDPTLAVRVLSAETAALQATLDASGGAVGSDGRIYLVDPHGNLVLSYPPDAEQKGVLDDLERLLKVSQIG